jgi:tetratricopeptide (TPR) repeat protein
MGNFLLGWACAAQSNWQDAINAFSTILPITDRDAGDLMSLAFAYASEGRRTDVLPMLEEARQKTTLMYVPLYRIAATYLAMGDRKQALEWLEKAATEDLGWVVWIKVDPRCSAGVCRLPHLACFARESLEAIGFDDAA